MNLHACSKIVCAILGQHTCDTCVTCLSCSWFVPYFPSYIQYLDSTLKVFEYLSGKHVTIMLFAILKKVPTSWFHYVLLSGNFMVLYLSH